MKEDIFAILGIIALIVAIVALVPLGTIWSLNQLFRLEIEYNFASWLAAFWLLLMCVKVEKGK